MPSFYQNWRMLIMFSLCHIDKKFWYSLSEIFPAEKSQLVWHQCLTSVLIATSHHPCCSFLVKHWFYKIPIMLKISKFHLISWYVNFVEVHSFRRFWGIAFLQYFHTKKWGEVLVFYAMQFFQIYSLFQGNFSIHNITFMINFKLFIILQ